jgi:prepilin-type N-terminal cleavage/methylation domain-containing protein
VKKAFTLIEILIAVVIIAVLMALLVPALSMAKAKAQERRDRENCPRYQKEHNAIPNSPKVEIGYWSYCQKCGKKLD